MSNNIFPVCFVLGKRSSEPGICTVSEVWLNLNSFVGVKLLKKEPHANYHKRLKHRCRYRISNRTRVSLLFYVSLLPPLASQYQTDIFLALTVLDWISTVENMPLDGGVINKSHI